MEPKYYPINEAAARQAKAMWSFRDYVDGSETSEYRKEVNRVYDMAKEAAKERPGDAEKVYRLADSFARKYADHINIGFQIELMCPSVMIAGASKFPVHKKEKQNARRDKHREEYEEIMKIPERIQNIAGGTAVIKSSDADAIEQLRQKIGKLKEEAEVGKAMNAHFRKKGTMKGFNGLTAEQAAELDKDIKESIYKVPCAPFELANIRARIKAAEERIKRIQKLKASSEAQSSACVDFENNDFKIVEDAEAMRIRIYFDDKPSQDIRDILKSHGFNWAPSVKAWQRQLTENARAAARQIIKQIERRTSDE